MRTQLLEFITRHSVLVSAGFIILCALGLIEWIQRALGSRALSATEATVLISRRQAKIIDLREKAEFSKGHIPTAMHIDEIVLENLLKKQQTSIPIVFILSHAGPPFALLRRLKLAGFSELYHLAGGLESWQQAHLPTTNLESK